MLTVERGEGMGKRKEEGRTRRRWRKEERRKGGAEGGKEKERDTSGNVLPLSLFSSKYKNVYLHVQTGQFSDQMMWLGGKIEETNKTKKIKIKEDISKLLISKFKKKYETG